MLAAWIAATPASASALAPPVIDASALGAAIEVNVKNGPPEATEQRALCVEPFMSGPVDMNTPLSQGILDLPGAWRFSRGAGQVVAVIDTGVNPHPRLNVRPGGDFVAAGGDGTQDCDGHGTLVAGLIAGRPSPRTASPASRPTRRS